MDWDQGLPPDVLALVARAGGHHAMKAMRGVSKSWQEGFELGVTGIRIGFEDPLPLPWGKAAQRFPGLTSLDLGRSRADEERDLPALGSFPKLQKLFLGPWVELYLPGEYDHVGLSSRLTDAGMVHLRGLPLTQLGLNGCRAVSDLGMECLRGMPLRLLDLNGCTKVMDVGIEMLRGMRLEGLHLAGLFHLTPSALESLRGMPLARLNLFDGRLALSEAGLQRLRGLPITSLNLSTIIYCLGPTVPNLDLVLPGMPLSVLNLSNWSALADADLRVLARLPLKSLTLFGCYKLTDAGMATLRGLPLTRLDLTCTSLTDVGLRHLQGLPLVSLGLGYCCEITSAGLIILLGMPLTCLGIGGWTLKDAELQVLGSLSLSTLHLDGCTRITDVGMRALEGMPLTRINIDNCVSLSLACKERWSRIVHSERWVISFAKVTASL